MTTLRTYPGACFCGAVRFEVDGDLSHGTMRCNCRFCRKMRYWEMRLPDPDGLRILSGAQAIAITPSQHPLGEGEAMQHAFCQSCGTRLWTKGNIAEMGGRVTLVFVPALEDVAIDELLAAPVHYANGAENDWWHAPADTAHL
ncbi:GFA family protein [Paracoccus aminophilus]|uniref:CENP-V/GFA domain-containing protein n=1 Tax=Paracoccus aminophilus JCM 7686 TaxID=1367847 RepID=S5YYI9_PARAH|nr:GFA family protein [Paracoccus aminophilus]AGT10266.1 hypothetical protein JCM7686_3230 [Paracoccus aminophilus JCM 7686]